MASPQKRLSNNVPGDFYVDSTCINCDTCRQLAPHTFGDDGEYSFVEHQPDNEKEERAALYALLACPTSSIGAVGNHKAREAMEDFPLPIADEVFLLGFNAENSFGANSYFIRHPEGNWMIDSPRFTPFLVKKLTALGGVRYHFFSHSDDVADGAKFAKAFGSRRIIHQGDQKGMRDAEILLEGREPVPFDKDFLVIPTPGHTRGHSVLLYKNKFLFTGDHLWLSRRTGHLGASRQYNWHSWSQQIESMKKLENFSFEWVLPGHGRQAHLAPAQMKRELHQLIEQMPNM